MVMFLTCMTLSAAIFALVTWLTMWLVLSMEEKSNGTIEGVGRKRRTVQEATAPFTVIQQR